MYIHMYVYIGDSGPVLPSHCTSSPPRRRVIEWHYLPSLT